MGSLAPQHRRRIAGVSASGGRGWGASPARQKLENRSLGRSRWSICSGDTAWQFGGVIPALKRTGRAGRLRLLGAPCVNAGPRWPPRLRRFAECRGRCWRLPGPFDAASFSWPARRRCWPRPADRQGRAEQRWWCSWRCQGAASWHSRLERPHRRPRSALEPKRRSQDFALAVLSLTCRSQPAAITSNGAQPSRDGEEGLAERAPFQVGGGAPDAYAGCSSLVNWPALPARRITN